MSRKKAMFKENNMRSRRENRQKPVRQKEYEKWIVEDEVKNITTHNNKMELSSLISRE